MPAHFIDIPYTPDGEALCKQLGLEPGSDEAGDFLALLERARPFIHPKAVVFESPVETVDTAHGLVLMDGVKFSSRLMADNFVAVETAWPYLATCGRELYDFVMAIADPFERYWGDAVMQSALAAATGEMEKFLRETLYSGKTAVMSPGSLEEWPITGQIPLFRLFGDIPARLGVTLTDSLLMIPNKSVSGVRFPNEHGYVNCRLCPKEQCPNRQAAYEDGIFPALLT